MTPVLEISGLRKTYRSRKGARNALDGFDMVVEAGQVHGFLGPNGSGKTTTLRTLLGLIQPDGGRMTLLGREVPRHLPEVAGRVGAIVESPQFFGRFTAETTLSLLADAGGVDRGRVPAVLDLVGLRDRAKEKVKTYSLGMKQRLAVASALLKEPTLLILDEPANGLDPGGIREMRTLMRDLSASGMTVLLSSHILAEIQLICDSVTIISAGRRITAGSVTEVLAQHTSGAVRVSLEPDTDREEAARILREAGAQVTVETAGHLTVRDVTGPAQITRLLAQHEIYLCELTPIAADLEDAFLELTGTAPVEGHHRQVDENALAAGQNGWGR
ncbi:ATP-binding cassette domain-containing protein [Actinoplanes hulinensis]|uniref:ATP-binding cassette domain-containing protein n=1 Tax=Actinoplanes hulinensis TaxID=1144547 RepID=A0ABS7AXL2_9ACTN|nr:ATP-binding cassette domain-containing protein [Actinoplanes hulinensis]MBW6433432.1 ATP-binding cassette domain-containing protein [Actinoplanes hulinensis]